MDTRLDVYYERDFKYTDYRKTWLILLVPAGICAAIGFNGLVSLSGIEKFSKAYQAVEKITYSGNLFVQIMASAIAAPIVEELLFRGLIFKTSEECNTCSMGDGYIWSGIWNYSRQSCAVCVCIPNRSDTCFYL